MDDARDRGGFAETGGAGASIGGNGRVIWGARWMRAFIARPRLMMKASPGRSARTWLGSTLNACCNRADPAPVAPTVSSICVEYSTTRLVPANAMTASGVFDAMADNGLDRAEDPFRLRWIAEARCGLGSEDQGGVEAAGLLEAGRHRAGAGQA